MAESERCQKAHTRLAGKLFIYAFNTFEEHNHLERLETLTRSTVNGDDEQSIHIQNSLRYLFLRPFCPLSTLTSVFLTKGHLQNKGKKILTAILAVYEPLVISDLREAAQYLLLLCVPSTRTGRRRSSTFHTILSLDFLTTPGRAPEKSTDYALCWSSYGFGLVCFLLARWDTDYLWLG